MWTPKTSLISWPGSTGSLCREEDDFPQAFQVLLTAMATDLDHVRAHTRLLLKALEWEGRGQDKSLLLRGGELKRSEEWLATSRDRDPAPTPLMVQFLLAGREAATVRQRLTLSSVSFALVVTLALAVATYFLYREAGSQKESALARGLTAQIGTPPQPAAPSPRPERAPGGGVASPAGHSGGQPGPATGLGPVTQTPGHHVGGTKIRADQRQPRRQVGGGLDESLR